MALNTVSEQKTIVKSAVLFFSGTMVSRVSGFLRDLSMAFFFGAEGSIAAFLVALRLAVLLRRIFGEGALLNGFVPHFETHRTEDGVNAAKFFRDVFFSLFCLLILITSAAELFLYYLKSAYPNSEVLPLVMLILPGVVFVCLFGICSGLLHCEKHFFITSVAPVAYNAIWIAAVWSLGHYPPAIAAVGLSCAISLAFLFQWLMTMPKTIGFLRTHLSWREMASFRFFPPGVKKMVASLSLGVIGVTAAQINTALDALFSRFACLEGPAYLNYAIHLQQLPLALFGVGIASVLLPSLSKTAAEPTRMAELVEFALSKSMWFLIPCTAAILVGSSAAINLLYGRGHFSDEALLQTTQCLWGYGLGLVPMALTLLLPPLFYARKDYKTPLWCSLISIGLNLALNALFVWGLRLGPASLAFSTSLSALVNAGLIMSQVDIRFSFSFRRTVGKITASALFAALCTGWVGYLFLQDPTWFILHSHAVVWTRHFPTQCLHFMTLALSFLGSFLFSAICLNRKEVIAFLTTKR